MAKKPIWTPADIIRTPKSDKPKPKARSKPEPKAETAPVSDIKESKLPEPHTEPLEAAMDVRGMEVRHGGARRLRPYPGGWRYR